MILGFLQVISIWMQESIGCSKLSSYIWNGQVGRRPTHLQPIPLLHKSLCVMERPAVQCLVFDVGCGVPCNV